jgi:hypothetical protein
MRAWRRLSPQRQFIRGERSRFPVFCAIGSIVLASLELFIKSGADTGWHTKVRVRLREPDSIVTHATLLLLTVLQHAFRQNLKK